MAMVVQWFDNSTGLIAIYPEAILMTIYMVSFKLLCDRRKWNADNELKSLVTSLRYYLRGYPKLGNK